MSLFVFLLWILTCINIFRIVILKRKGLEMIGWFIFQLITTIVQIRFDGFTWQLTLLYVLPLFWLLYYKTMFKKLQSVIMVILFVLTSLVLVIFSTPKIEIPTGKYIVGTTTMYLIDEERERELPVHIYYPANDSEGKSPEKWFKSESMVEGFAEFYSIPPMILSQINNVKTNSYKDVEMVDGEFPVVIISHGWASLSGLHINLLELLASHGYIVVAADHTEISSVTMLHTEEIVLCNQDLMRDDQLIEDGVEVIERYKEDLEFIVERLYYLNDHHKVLYHHMDMDKLALIGHSIGGGAGVSYAMEHSVSLVIGMDAWMEPLEKVTPLEMPSLFFRSSQWEGYNSDNQLRIITDQVLQPKGSKHPDFTMAHKLSPGLTIIGYTSGKSKESYEQTILAYLDRYLLDKDTQIKKKIPWKQLQ